MLKVGNDAVTQADMWRLDGPRLPANKENEDLWINDSILQYAGNILTKYDRAICQDTHRKPTYFADSYLYQQLMKEELNNIDL